MLNVALNYKALVPGISLSHSLFLNVLIPTQFCSNVKFGYNCFTNTTFKYEYTPIVASCCITL